jgi:hypothetical protein
METSSFAVILSIIVAFSYSKKGGRQEGSLFLWRGQLFSQDDLHVVFLKAYSFSEVQGMLQHINENRCILKKRR